MTSSGRDRPQREGWNSRADRYGAWGQCPHCLHENGHHFWWERGGQVGAEMERGCRDCAHGICVSIQQRERESMSSVNLCERCGSLMLAKALGTLEMAKFPGDQYTRLEFCPACISDLVSFLAEKPERNRGAAFTEPWEPAEQSEAALMLEAGPCGDQYTSNDIDFMCLRPKGHKGYHIDGTKEWMR